MSLPFAVWIPAAVALAVMVAFYGVVGVVFVAVMRRWAPVRPAVRLVAHAELPPDVAAALMPLVRAMRDLSFTDVGHLEVRERPESTMYFGVLRSGTGLERGGIAVRVITIRKRQVADALISVCSDLADGTTIETTNLNPLESFAAVLGDVLSLSGVKEPGLLLRVHRARTPTARAAVKRFDQSDRTLAEWFSRHQSQAFQEWARSGVPELNRDGSAYRLTWIGAARMFLMMVPPVRTVRAAWTEHRTRATMRRLGFGPEELERARAWKPPTLFGGPPFPGAPARDAAPPATAAAQPPAPRPARRADPAV